MSGKGSKPRPLSIDRNKFEENWNRIFGNNETKEQNDYQDILSTEDCILDSFDKDQQKD